MKTNNVKGRNFVVIIGAYLIVKAVLNMIIGGGFNITDLILAVICFFAMFSGLQYLNYATAVVIAIPVISHMLYNIIHLPGTLIYLIEAFIDVGAIILLVTNADIKGHFTNKWSEISSLFK